MLKKQIKIFFGFVTTFFFSIVMLFSQKEDMVLSFKKAFIGTLIISPFVWLFARDEVKKNQAPPRLLDALKKRWELKTYLACLSMATAMIAIYFAKNHHHFIGYLFALSVFFLLSAAVISVYERLRPKKAEPNKPIKT